jgi:hypothetical protein
VKPQSKTYTDFMTEPEQTNQEKQPDPTTVAARENVEETVRPVRSFPAFNESPFKAHAFQPRAQLVARNRPLVILTPKAYQQMLLYVEIADKEVGWMGAVTRLENNRFLIEETFLLEQEVTAVETELSVEGCSKLADELLLRGDEGFDLLNKMRFWGHSHVRMGTSPSGTDESTMLRFRDENLDWYVRGIFNKLGRAEFTVYFFDIGFAVCDVNWCVIDLATGNDLTPKGGSAFAGQFRDYRYDPKPLVPEQPAESVVPADVVAERVRKYERMGLSPLLVPSAELRAQIEAEFFAKVLDRVYSFGGFGSLFSIFSASGDSKPAAGEASAEELELARAGKEPEANFQQFSPAPFQYRASPEPNVGDQPQKAKSSWWPQWMRDICSDLFN